MTAARTALRLKPDHGLFPPRDYLAYRGEKVYGAPLSQAPPGEFIRYLEWCKAFPRPIG